MKLLAINSKLLCAEDGGGPGSVLNARTDPAAAGPWEDFEEQYLDNGLVALRSCDGYYVSAQPDGTVAVDRFWVRPWETWSKVVTPNGIGYRSIHGLYLCADLGLPVSSPNGWSGCRVVANRPIMGPYETFTQQGGEMPLPPRPTRDQACAIRNQLQGISINGHHLFDPEIGWSTDKAFRVAAYAAHRAVRLPDGTPQPDTHVCLSLDMTGLACLPHIKSVIRGAITEGGMTAVLLHCMGDGNEAGQPNHDPGALNFPWLMANFNAIVDYMEADEDLTPWIVFGPGFDGVIPGWQPWWRVNEFVRMARARLDRLTWGRGYLNLELAAGYWCWSGERDDWATADGQMVDVVLYEYPIHVGPPDPPPANLLLPDGSDWAPTATDDQRAPWTQVWLIHRLIGDRYIRPAAQPPNYDPHPPYANADTPRGRKFFIVWERTTYRWHRQHCDISVVHRQTQATIDLGAEWY